MTNDLKNIVSENVPSDPDEKAIFEERSLQRERGSVEIAGMKQDTEERKQYASKVFRLVAYWLFSVLAIVLLEGFGRAFGFFSLASDVLLALVTTTTLGIVGTLGIVVRYLFTRSQ